MKLIAQSENIEKFIENNYIYIDKTEYIYNLTKNYERVFFSRPRRFGKSLTLNTIGTLFEKGVDPYFKGTWIYNKWKQDKYPVLHLSFLKFSVTDVVQFKKDFCNEILKFANENNITGFNDSNEPKTLIGNIFSAMPDGCQLVLLIDEYDCQLTANINNKVLYENFRTLFREFYAVLKGEKHIKFMALTGVTRLKDVSIFSVGSDIKDLSYNNAYSKLIGFTRDEIKHFYLDYLKLGVSYEKNKTLESVTDSEIENLIDRMAAHYDSYCFDEFNKNKVFSTYSVNGFLQDIYEKKTVRFGDYWYDIGGLPSILMNYMESHNLNIENLLTSEIEIPYNDFANPTSLIDINENVLMCQTGYLTLKSEIVPGYDIILGPANREVRTALFLLLSLKIFDTNNSAFSLKNRYVFENGTVEEIIALFNEVLAALSYDKYPVDNESVLRALLQVYLLGRNHDVRIEQHNSKGRSDILVNFPKRRVVLELKYTTEENEEPSKLDEAEKQIKEKGYGLENLADRELLQIACVFNGDKRKRQITMFKRVEK
ncbi:PD-(D/E)XK nuclease superfamily protein [Succinivibrio dextrinosolvens DSM 3072]|uniref:PD-(D/E)XK nuclease superfamily protein n=1 Tax=Succinivibrio dextrinosolvens DSM 3072 TaxID=1123324 RepID=A0A1T4VPH7_9GAMM|nr:AAA family ATPase [Succinivibrio dextrinosolvens]SKA66856.1 PD-(D/E)XK nuclease superfamily protein [Succinivibrio dextrinosolvens DSM 3072]